MAESGEHPTHCPQCRESLPRTGKFRLWCPGCEWNLQGEPTARIVWNRKGSLFSRALRSFGNRFATAQFEALLKVDETVLRPRLTRSKLLAYGLALLVSVVYVGLLAAGLMLIWPLRMPQTIVGIFLVLLFVAVRPRWRKPDGERRLARVEAPGLFALVDQVSAALGTRAPDCIAIDGTFNATFGTVGPFRRSILTIGLPLWCLLSGQQRVALVGHELAHGINNDPLRGTILAAATQMLFSWIAMVRPDRLVGATPNVFVALAEFPFRLGLLLIAKLLHLWATALLALIWHESQRAEYLADAIGARASGTGPARELFERIAYADCVVAVAERIAYQIRGESDFFEDFPRYVADLPDLERERLKRQALRAGVQFDSSHPPNAFRLRMLARNDLPVRVVLTPQASKAIDEELRAMRPQMQGSLIAAYFPDR